MKPTSRNIPRKTGQGRKRSQSINLARMRKLPQRFPLKPISAAMATAFLAGCGSSNEATVYESLDECQGDNPDLYQECETAYQQALREAADTAPKYGRLRDCEIEFGTNTCVPYQANNNSWFMPAMAGFLFARAWDRPNYYYHSPMFTSYRYNSSFNDRWVSADGRIYGSRYKRKVSVNKDTFKPKPKVKRTISRGGFGSKVAAKSKWRSSSRSSSRSWGG